MLMLASAVPSTSGAYNFVRKTIASSTQDVRTKTVKNQKKKKK